LCRESDALGARWWTVKRTAREILNELRWHGPNRLADANVFYRNRTRSEGYRLIRGSQIVQLERRYFTTATARLPYYKIEKIESAGEILFER
jgi:uncharacterized protein (UPF0248 family)